LFYNTWNFIFWSMYSHSCGCLYKLYLGNVYCCKWWRVMDVSYSPSSIVL